MSFSTEDDLAVKMDQLNLFNDLPPKSKRQNYSSKSGLGSDDIIISKAFG